MNKRVIKIIAKDSRDTIMITAVIKSPLCRTDLYLARNDLADKLMAVIPTIKYVGVALHKIRARV